MQVFVIFKRSPHPVLGWEVAAVMSDITAAESCVEEILNAGLDVKTSSAGLDQPPFIRPQDPELPPRKRGTRY